MKEDLSRSTCILAVISLALAAAFTEFLMGRHLWGVSGTPGVWSVDIWSPHNSQFLLDPYTLTHISHGILLYAIVTMAFRSLPLGMRLLLVVGIEGAWEILENTDFIINRYRADTVSLNYFGDSIVNSMGDILACMGGFTLASKLPKRVIIAVTVALELLLLLWTKDNLTLNIVMLIHPSSAIKAWQIGK